MLNFVVYVPTICTGHFILKILTVFFMHRAFYFENLTCAAVLQHPQSLSELLEAVQVLVVLTVQEDLLGVREEARDSDQERGRGEVFQNKRGRKRKP